MKTIINTSGLTCAVCSQKIEDELTKSKKYTAIKVNPIRETITISTNDEIIDYEYIQSVITKYEHGATLVIPTKDNIEDKEDKKRLFIKLIIQGIGVVLLILGALMEYNVIPLSNQYYLLAIFIPSYILLGFPIIYNAFNSIKAKDFFNENTLMLLASIGGIILKEYTEAIMVLLLYQIGEFLTDLAVVKSKKSIFDIVDLRPKKANLIENDIVKTIDSMNIKIGDVILIKTGETIPCDGIIIEGESYINSFSLDGESVPKYASIDSEVYTGTINVSNIIKVKVNKLWADTTAAKIIEYIENSDNKSKSEKFITKFARIYTKIVVLAAVLVAFLVPFIIWLVVKGSYYDLMIEYVHKGLIFLVISCPCALVLSIPLAFFIGIGTASKNHILVRSSADIEQLTKINSFVFDKTGTLTKGSLNISKINKNIEISTKDIVFLLAICEHYSAHPIAKIINSMNLEVIEESKYSEYKEIVGQGVTCVYSGNKYYLGNELLFKNSGVDTSATKFEKSTIYLFKNNQYIGSVSYEDEIKENSSVTVNELKNIGKSVYMVTGDNEQSAKNVASKLGIDDIKVFHNCLPLDKVGVISKIKSKNNLVLFMGDGINDAPVLKNANLGVSMGQAGSDLAIESSDIIIMNDDPYKLLDGIKIAKKTRRIALENIIIAVGIKFLIMLLTFFGIEYMWLAIFADVGVALICVLNCLRILTYKSKVTKKL
ncbi:MAG: cadmium-translocating P-type ATPase [Acholeplasmatales bacterium]|jgi:Cd2+/Zn2+-exporting ATPase|nr:cadmium-translocating P-type ATPase [Acholeplasmatales bacterium]